MHNYSRTHDCGILRNKDVKEKVTLCGWVNRRRDHGGLIFIDLRDNKGITQLVFDPTHNKELHKSADLLRSEWVISIEGVVIPRKEGMINPKMPTGEIEIDVTSMNILSKAKTPPFSVCDDSIDVSEELRLKYRFLDIRRGNIADNLRLRSKVTQMIRNSLSEQEFCEISTPVLLKKTPEGAREFVVPSRLHPGSFYALPQSPQIFKQLLMVSGMDRYFQIAPCFRDEDLRSDRQPEFSQVDIEMSFETPKTLYAIIEKLMQKILKETHNFDLTLPIKKMTHKEAMEKYGSDKPDLRIPITLKNLEDIAKRSDFTVFKEQIRVGGTVRGLCVKGGADISRKGIDQYTSFVSQFKIKGLAWMKMQDGSLNSSIVKFFSGELQKELIDLFEMKDGDIIFMIADDLDSTLQALDHLRRKIATDRNLIDPKKFELLWVIDFPLFSHDKETGKIVSEHHPFTAPHPDDLSLLDSDPTKVRSYAYDLVLNGYEIGGGSQRIHDSDLQEKIFSLMDLSKDEIENKFGFFVKALQYGTPPHLGIALGLDRIMMILLGTENIRDVIAFPKTQKGTDLMIEAPASLSDDQISEFHIKVEH